MNQCSAQPFCSQISTNIWQISTTAYFDKMRIAFLWLIVEVTNDSVFLKQEKVPQCIWFAFYSTLLFSSQGNFCVFYLFKLSGLTAGKLREDFTEGKFWVFQSLPLKLSKAEQSVTLFLHYPLNVFQAKIKKNPSINHGKGIINLADLEVAASTDLMPYLPLVVFGGFVQTN